MEGLLKVGCACLVLAASVAWPARAADETAAAGELETVRGRISALLEELNAATDRRSAVQRELRGIETDEQAARRRLQQTRNEVAAARDRQTELRAQADAQQAELRAERSALAQQLRLAYINGPAERLRLVLSQQDAAAVGRQLVYAGYLSRHRSAGIDNLETQAAALAATRAELAAEVDALVELEAQANAQVSDIARLRAERAALVASLTREVASRDSEIEQLRAQEQELTELLAQLARAVPGDEGAGAEPFAGKAASLSWPAEGPLLKRFNDPRADGSLRWTGVLLGAAAGAEVRAVYHGRVVFADWLSGMGLLTILQHDDGYMSLYGHNQDLLKAVGEWVSPGEPIAHVGDSGGQASAGLYFEIRKDGEPVNPARWIAEP